MRKDCLICAFPFDGKERLPTVGACGHSDVCSICFLRIRSLQRVFKCPVCQQNLEHVICCTKEGASFSDFSIWGDSIGPEYSLDQKAQMFFPKEYYKTNVESIWICKCKICSQVKRDLKGLRTHLQVDHNMHMCQLCIDNKQAFPSEQKVYTQTEYENHLRRGDGDGSEGHPNCEFCRKRFYDKTPLFVHLTRDHFSCHICEKQGILFKYFADYPHLENHFRGQHFLCEEPTCLAKKFTVFGNDIDYAAHNRQYHPQYQVRRNIPIHFKVRRPKLDSSGGGADNDNGDEISPTSADDSYSRGGAGGGGGGHIRFEGGTGGRARGGEWQLELAPTASRDPRDHGRGHQGAAAASAGAEDSNPFADIGRPPIEDSLEEYPALIAPAGGGGASSVFIGGWGTSGKGPGKSSRGGGGGVKDQFPALGGSGKLSAASLVAGGAVGGGGGGGVGVDAGLWNARIKTDKRLNPRGGGISKPAAGSMNFKDATDPPLSIAARLHLGETVASVNESSTGASTGTGGGAKPAAAVAKVEKPSVVASDPFGSLKVLKRDHEDDNYKKISSGSEKSKPSSSSAAAAAGGGGAAKTESSSSKTTAKESTTAAAAAGGGAEADDFQTKSAAAIGTAAAALEQSEASDYDYPPVAVTPTTKKAATATAAAVPAAKKKTGTASAPAAATVGGGGAGGWGTALKTAGLSGSEKSQKKKKTPGITVVSKTPFPASAAGAVASSSSSSGKDNSSSSSNSYPNPIASIPSFDDLKPIGRLQRDLQEMSSFPNYNYSNSSSNSPRGSQKEPVSPRSSSAAAAGGGGAAAALLPPPPPGLGGQQQQQQQQGGSFPFPKSKSNDSLESSVAKNQFAATAPPPGFLGGGGGRVAADSSGSSSSVSSRKIGGGGGGGGGGMGWTKIGGTSETASSTKAAAAATATATGGSNSTTAIMASLAASSLAAAAAPISDYPPLSTTATKPAAVPLNTTSINDYPPLSGSGKGSSSSLSSSLSLSSTSKSSGKGLTSSSGISASIGSISNSGSIGNNNVNGSGKGSNKKPKSQLQELAFIKK